jgi:hypothetical protein
LNPIATSNRNTRLILAALAVVAVLLQLPLYDWWVEDAAIAFSYARNLGNGDGLVPFAGGERVEGYSDPLWVVLLAMGHAIGLNPFFFSKLLGALFAAATVPLAWWLARELPVPERHPELRTVTPLLAAALVATNAQHALWGAAGLENPLFTLLWALGAWRVLVESRAGRAPWAALVYVGLALTRPEGVVYAAMGLGVGAWADLRARRFARIAGTFFAFALPFFAYHAARYAYFALPYPTTYYAKIVDLPFDVWAWGTRAWTYPRRWASELGWGWLFPVVFAGATGTTGRKGLLLGAWIVVLVGLIFAPDAAIPARITAICLTGALLPLLALPSAPRALFTASAVFTLTFAVRANGDWMDGFRWMALMVVPLCALYAVGTAELASRLPRRAAAALVVVCGVIPIAVHVTYILRYPNHPETSPQQIGERVVIYRAMADRLHLHRPWLALDHGMGGMSWWSPPDGMSIDPIGLTDVPFALHRGNKRFRSTYVLSPPRADFAHVKASRGTLLEEPVFRDRFVALRDPEKDSENEQNHNWVNRGLLTADAWTGAPLGVVFDNGAELVGWAIRSPEVSAATGLYVEVGLRRAAATDLVLRAELVAADGARSLLPALDYGELFPASAWRPGELVIGRFAVALPSDLSPGSYGLSFFLQQADGAEIGPRPAVLSDAVTVVVSASSPAEDDARAALAAAGRAQCAAAEASWVDAVEHQPLDHAWEDALRARLAPSMQRCWADHAAAAAPLDAQIDALAQARRWDLRSPAALEVGRRLADALWPQAEAAREAGDDAEALRLFEAVVHAAPTRSWARRYAEEARGRLLGDPW